jgi:hypothetical protein
MTRKHFERIAQVFRVNDPTGSERQSADDIWYDLIDDLCIELKAINPHFNEKTFRKACHAK